MLVWSWTLMLVEPKKALWYFPCFLFLPSVCQSGWFTTWLVFIGYIEQSGLMEKEAFQQFSALTTIAFWWVIENQKLRFRSGFSLLRVVKCLLMPRSGEPSPVPEMNTHPLIFFDLKHLSVVRLRHTWLLNPRLFQLHLTWLPPFDYSALTWSWGHQRKEGEITCSCSNLGFHLMGLRLPLFSPAKLIRSLVLILLYSVALSVLSPTASVSVKFKCGTWEQRCPSVV